ncbi:MAG: PAS domain S-box protein [Anaerolineales bacterium]|nr:PAS domain S-box protein [Anaerolineales bacterium]
MIQINVISIILLITTVINMAVSFISWGRRGTKTGFYFALGMSSITLWTFAAALGYMVIPLDLTILFAKLDAIGYNFAIVFLFFAAMYFARLDKWADHKTLRLLIFFIPVSNTLLTITNEWHAGVWAGFELIDNNIYIFKHGPAFIWITSTSYLLIATILLVLFGVAQNGSVIQRRQARLLIGGTVFPIIANIMYRYGAQGIEGIDWSSVTFSVTGFLFLRALQDAQFINIIPIARDVLINSSSDGMMVVDTQYRIIDSNPAMSPILGRSSGEDLIGYDLQQSLPVLHSHILETMGQKSRMEFEIGAIPFDILISPLYEKDQQIGYLIVFRNITEIKQKELQLQLLNHAVEQSPTSIIITDKTGNITFVNPFFVMLTGYSLTEVLGKKPNMLQSGQTPDQVYQAMWQSILSAQVWRGELLNKKKNGEFYWVSVVMAPVLDSDGDIQSYISIQEDITERKLAEQALEDRFLEIQSLNKDLQEAQNQIVDQQRELAILEERQRLGRNLHDSVNQSIHSLMLFSETLIALLQNGQTEQAINAAVRIHKSGEQALKEARMLVHEGRVSEMSNYEELVEAIENRFDMVERRTGIQAVLSYDNLVHEDGFPANSIVDIYWIIIESLNNSLKHSQASHVQVEMTKKENQLSVEIKDNGIGFNQGQARGGFGLTSMQERATSLNGTLSVESSIHIGTRVKFSMEI